MAQEVRLGTLGHPERAVVVPGGRVTPWPAGWSLGWLVGAEDRWHLPEREASVRQRLVDGAPVVETAMRVPGGDAVHRTFAASAGVESWLVVEVENLTPVPFAVAFVLLPAPPAVGQPGIYELEVGERWISVNGSAAVALPRSPNRAVALPRAGGDVVEVVTGGEAGEEVPVRAICPDGAAAAAVVYPLPHTARIRLAVPMRRSPLDAARVPPVLPDAADVARGWARHLQEGPRFQLPDEQLMEALAASRAQRLLDDPGEPGPRADVYSEARGMLVREERSGLVLAEGVPPDWYGAGWEVHDLPTVFGSFGYAVRWHGQRPALLWELQLKPGVGAVTLTAPTLDPAWSTTVPVGEALLASSEQR